MVIVYTLDDLTGILIVESVIMLIPDTVCLISQSLLCSTSYVLVPESDWLILLLKLL